MSRVLIEEVHRDPYYVTWYEPASDAVVYQWDPMFSHSTRGEVRTDLRWMGFTIQTQEET